MGSEPTTDATVLELIGGPLDGALSLCRTDHRFLDIRQGGTIKDKEWAIFPPELPRDEVEEQLPAVSGRWRVEELAACIVTKYKYKKVIVDALNRGK